MVTNKRRLRLLNIGKVKKDHMFIELSVKHLQRRMDPLLILISSTVYTQHIFAEVNNCYNIYLSLDCVKLIQYHIQSVARSGIYQLIDKRAVATKFSGTEHKI